MSEVTDFIDRLRNTLISKSNLTYSLGDVNAIEAEIIKLNKRIAELEWNNSELKDENAELKQRVTEMEQRINELYADNEALKEHYPHFIDYPKAGDDIPCVGES
jgi:predicted nuclease with TOPRIM domain